MTDKIDKAFEMVSRADFMLPDDRQHAGLDVPFSIGHGQNISQPYTVKRMLEWLDPKPGDNVLDVGSGSGWTSVLLAELVGEKGRVTAVERITELLKFGRDNARKYSKAKLSFYPAGQTLGYPKDAPYDKILVSAATARLPDELVEQLKDGGRMVIPVGHDILVVDKDKKSIKVNKHYGYVFVPLVT